MKRVVAVAIGLVCGAFAGSAGAGPLDDPGFAKSLTCSACHGADARGGQLGGPNLLRSQLVLMDQDGEQILPVVQKGRPERGMPPFQLPEADIKAKVDAIGPVNLMAIDEFRSLEERHAHLSAQQKDLVDAMASLRETINSSA